MERVITLPDKGKCVFVGDTHGDIIASKVILKNFLYKNNYYVVFLGDYVDRGKRSKENIDYLLEKREKYDNLILLAGNHEVYPICECSPSNFWEALSPEEFNHYKEIFLKLPWCVTGNNLIGVHAAIPDVEKLLDIENIEVGGKKWFIMLWGDFVEKKGELLGSFLGRPKLGKDYFEKVMGKLKKNVLIRSHDPKAKEVMFDKRCLTIFTSSEYGVERKIAIVDLEKDIKNVDDIELVSLDLPDLNGI
ncbi:MAG TPA: metallophosphoesterase family protein [Candidatus Ratteibacteria bacterium]|nr:metallophosphoesterase family protein [bacterium]HRR96246.1 metallophosphoesterase family protein [Candidatus Ratteibacteria bacterium]